MWWDYREPESEMSEQRFSVSVRVMGKVSSHLTVPEGPGLADRIKRKRERKKEYLHKGDKTVAELISEVSTQCSKQEKQKVCIYVDRCIHLHRKQGAVAPLDFWFY